ncbi:MAG: hypothetical protein JXQ73_09045 [Phycisphaerae bacterium]|nr:hypothetical protein [Phycisphaerae bacterium]
MAESLEGSFPCEPVPGVFEIRCAGDPREMGRWQGQALADAAHRGLREVVLENDRVHQIKPAWLPAGVILWGGRFLAGRTVPRDVQRHYPRQYERLLGIAEGSRLDLRDLWLMLFLEQQTQPALRIPACTSVAFAPERTTLAEPAIARVFDLPAETKPFNTLRWDSPTDRHASMQLTFPMLAGSHTGVNECGLAVAYNLGYPRDKSGCHVPITLIVQEVLERCARVDEALALIEQSPRSGGALLTLADADGDVVAVEISPTSWAVRRAQEGCVINTNHYQAQETTLMDTAFGDHAHWWQGRGWRWIGPSSLARLDRARRLLNERGAWSLDDLISLMADHGEDGAGSDMTICRHPPPYETTISAILLPKRHAMLIAPGQPCCQRFVSRPLRPNDAC